MKILTTKAYEELLEHKDRYEARGEVIKLLMEDKNDLEEKLKESLLNLKIKKCIVGKRGIGKTCFLQRTILPQLKNFFLIDMTGEYNYISEEDKYSCDNSLSVHENKFNIINAIKKNVNKTIIIDGSGYVDNDISWTFELLKDRNFIISFQSISRSKPFIDFIDTVYLFDCMDSDFETYRANYYKFLYIPSHDNRNNRNNESY